jgi:NADH-quinone oxidoreductase subunit F
MGRSFCALGDAAATPFPAALKLFRNEWLAGTRTPADEAFAPAAATVFAAGAVR